MTLKQLDKMKQFYEFVNTFMQINYSYMLKAHVPNTSKQVCYILKYEPEIPNHK